MDPEVVQIGPGLCTKCGMALEPKVISLESLETENSELAGMRRRFRFALVLTIPVFLLAMAEMIPGAGLHGSLPARAVIWIEYLLATPVVLWAGHDFSARLGFDRQPDAEHVHADRDRNRISLALQRCGDTCAGDLPGQYAWPWWRT
jgi:hypothetical protein